MSEDSILQDLMNDLEGIKHQDKENAKEKEIAWKIQLIYACPYQTAKKMARPRLECGRPNWEIGDPDTALILRKIAALKMETCQTGLLFPYKDAACFNWPHFKGVYYHPEDPRGKAILRVKELNAITLDEEWLPPSEFEKKYGRKRRVFYKEGHVTFAPFEQERRKREEFLQEMVNIGFVSWKPKEPFGAPAWGYPLEDSYFSFQLMQAIEGEKVAEDTISIRPSQGMTAPQAQEFQDFLINIYDGRNGTNLQHTRNCQRYMGRSFSNERPFNRHEYRHIFPAMVYSKGEKRSYAEIHRDWIDGFSKGRFGEMSIPTEVPEKYKSICYKHRDSQSFPVVYGL